MFHCKYIRIYYFKMVLLPISVKFMKACQELGIKQAFTRYNNSKGNADTEAERMISEAIRLNPNGTFKFGFAESLPFTY